MLPGLTPDQVAAFDRDGYLIVPDALPPHAVRALLDETHRLLRDELSLDGHPLTKFQTGGTDGTEHVGDDYFLTSGDQVRFFFEEDAFDRHGRLAKPKERAVNKIGHCLHGRNPVFARVTAGSGTAATATATATEAATAATVLPFDGALSVAAVARSLGFRDPRCLQSMVICKQPEIGGAVPPHQDSTFLYTDPPSAVGFWYALEDATAANGCLSFWPGSHRTAPVRQRLVRRVVVDAGAGAVAVGTHMVDNAGAAFPKGHQEAADQQAPTDADPYILGEVKAGSLVLIHGNLLHKSERNRSDRGRIIYTFHVIEGDGTTYDEKNWLQPPAEGFMRLYDE
ncbi:phytanoyl-CoA dioxygenase [Niveomyces insectorum RCEF 264]|uniref:Phytanoyl-CoA dioxygenase n=1 Tax=Niveomyces insectorum RCEF 264 TaxID=1081102 RepID=A0A167S1D1_9HYPO|nr:phytanoyl-CoA dioxygenase [Niveomyces insectorum RCEF 264]